MNRFFNPYKGASYDVGINGKKILVLGASFYCGECDCPFFEKCTSTVVKNSSLFDTICPIYKKEGKVLHDEPSYCIEDAPRTYQNFATFISSLCGICLHEEVWNRIAFTNYVQFFLPSSDGKFRDTRKTDLSERDFEAFIETLQVLMPDVVVIWGSVINSRLKEQNKYVTDITELKRTEDYVCHMRIPGISHDISLINPYHPSSSDWFANIDKFRKYFMTVIKQA